MTYRGRGTRRSKDRFGEGNHLYFRKPVPSRTVRFMSDFYVYENWRAQGHRTKIHRAECSHCDHGRGQRGGTRAENGEWHGPFSNFNLADNTAIETGGAKSLCGLCRPSA